jgi:hypothetical protein
MGYSPINLPILSKLLSVYPDREAADILYNGFRYGFRKYYAGPRVPYESRNLKSVFNNPAIARENVVNEVNAGRIAGQCSYRPISNLKVSPIGLVPQKTGGIRLITNLSSSINGIVNDIIDSSYTSVQYSSFDKTVVMIKTLGFKAQVHKWT